MSLLKVTTNKGTSAIVMAPDPSGYAFCLSCSPRTCGVFGSRNTRRVLFVEEAARLGRSAVPCRRARFLTAMCPTPAVSPQGRAAMLPAGWAGWGSSDDRPGCHQPRPSSWGPSCSERASLRSHLCSVIGHFTAGHLWPAQTTPWAPSSLVEAPSAPLISLPAGMDFATCRGHSLPS